MLYIHSNDRSRSFDIGSLSELTAIAQFGERPGWADMLRARELGPAMLVELADRAASSADAIDVIYLPGQLYQAEGGFLEGTLDSVDGHAVNLSPRWREMCLKIASICALEAVRGDGPVFVESSATPPQGE